MNVQETMAQAGAAAAAAAEDAINTKRCVVVIDAALAGGKAANAAAVIALTIGQRHPELVGAPLVDASGASHPGLIPIGIAVLSAPSEALAGLRAKAVQAGCDVVDFPVQGQQTTDYQAFIDAVARVREEELRYVGVSLYGPKKTVGKLVGNLALLK
ncbi:MAG: hypothetical protein GAK35_00831 [Herbaspirillum frisingense]|uniref:DUF2000 domain-containing protein n=1 Tax=Herbaspirillum frisingense TaxID=92645 RepID=A0A7V8FZ57_9BURK|nr:MAG: hypothetical protein GAK35_00831 [Herbaspirillum frisingense]